MIEDSCYEMSLLNDQTGLFDWPTSVFLHLSHCHSELEPDRRGFLAADIDILESKIPDTLTDISILNLSMIP